MLTTAQWEQVDLLAATLDREQAIWVSGYLAGRSQLAPPTLGGGAAAPAAAAAGAAPGGRTLTVLYATDTGNSKELAGILAEQTKAKGVTTSVVDMADYKTRALKDEQDVLIIAATHGEGEPPPAALDFFEFIQGKRAPKLAGVRFSVLALGDSTYEHYCACGRILDERFAELGAERIADRVECDVDYEDDAAAWTETVVETFTPEAAPAVAAGAPVAAAGAAVAAAPSAYGKRNPFSAPVLENQVLTGRDSSKETRHLEFSLEDSGLTYAPGDALGIVAQNDPALVTTLLEQLELSPDAPVTLKKGETTLGEALAGTLEITAATPRFLTQWAELSGSKELQALTATDKAKERTAFFYENHILDITRQFPVKGLTADQFAAGLRPLQPRLYSIASSLAAAPDEVHLTVSTVQYALHAIDRTGVASGFLATLSDEDHVPVYVQGNDHFHLPADDAPIVMIGAGTGVAPYRAFMQERDARGASGKSWLVFGERNFRSDFLYQVEWQEQLKSGLLTKLDLAFSRDVRTPKTYVQDKLRANGRQLYEWLEEGAVLYVCGDANNMAPDVHRALNEIVAEHGGLDTDEAEEYLSGLKRDHRYRLDVY